MLVLTGPDALDGGAAMQTEVFGGRLQYKGKEPHIIIIDL